jgi:hypothetical protein
LLDKAKVARRDHTINTARLFINIGLTRCTKIFLALKIN